MAKKLTSPKRTGLKRRSTKNATSKIRAPRLEAKKRPRVEEFTEIGGSPIAGITLRQVLHGHTDEIHRIAWSIDGRSLASASRDGTVRIWDIETGESNMIFRAKTMGMFGVTWSTDNRTIASITDDSIVQFWDIHTRQEVGKQRTAGTQAYSIAFSPDGNRLAYASEDELTVCDLRDESDSFVINRAGRLKFNNSHGPLSLAWSPTSPFLACGFGGPPGESMRVLVIDPIIKKIVWSVDTKDSSYGLDWHPSGKYLASAGFENRIYICDIQTRQIVRILEGHTDSIESLCFSNDGALLITKAHDGTIRFWHCDTWNTVAILYEKPSDTYIHDVAFNPSLPMLASLGNSNTIIRIWDIDSRALLAAATFPEAVHYTTAKLVLVGDSGVGKTGLGWRLAHNEFKEHSSTHGQQFWVVPELKKIRDDGTECETVLWDLAGQPDYRLVHSLYLDDVNTALVLFDPTNRQEPLSGVDFWLNQLKNEDKKLRSSILVGARTDRGTSTLTDAEIQAFCKRNNVTGGYIATSAKEGKGLSQLMETLKDQIPWDALPATITTTTFKRIKEYVLSVKEKPRRKNVLLQPSDLRKQLEKLDKKWKFTDAEMMTAVGHLENHGYVKVLHGSNGDENILLSPDVLANLASSIVLEARRSPRGLGVLEEAHLLRGEYLFPELNKIDESESKILLDAATVLFLEHNLCFRENFNQQIFLVFPSLINEKRPISEGIKLVEGETYQVKGAVENLYASMVVLLGYTNTFVRTHQWQNQAQYEMGKGEVCGFQQINYDDGNIELVLNYDEQTPDPVRLMFRGLFERFLSRRELEIARYQTVSCKGCGTFLARNVVLDQLNKGKKFTYCHECGKKVMLPNPEPLTRLSPKVEVEIDNQQKIVKYRTAFEAALVRVKGLLRDKKKKKKSTCFISYAWGVSENERWVLQLAKDLRNADINVLLDRWDSPPGSNLDLYIDRILSSDFVIPVGTPELRKKYDTRKTDPVVAAELKLINLRVRQPTAYGDTVLPVLLTGTAKKSFTPQLQPLVSVDFRESEFYFRKLFDMIWRLYDLSFDNPLLEELQDSMTPRNRM